MRRIKREEKSVRSQKIFSVWAGFINFKIDIPHAKSRKDRRRVLHGLRDAIIHRFKASAIAVESDNLVETQGGLAAALLGQSG